MSWFSEGLKGVGHLVEKASPLIGFIPGIGPVAKAGISLAAKALGHHNPVPPGGSYDPEGDSLYGSETTPGDPNAGGGIGSYLKNALGDINPVTAGLGALGVVNAGQLGAKANKYAGDAYGSATGSYAERAGLRKQGINDLLHPQTPDTSDLTRIRSSNPYAQIPGRAA